MANPNQLENKIQLLVGVGNYGEQYEKTRHNAGFWFLDALAHEYAVSFRYEAKFLGQVARFDAWGSPCYLLKPQTYMNRSGQAVSALLKYYKIAPKNMLVAHDELDFDAGVVRFKQHGGHGGHNGLRDIISHTGERQFARLRLGIGHSRDNQGGKEDVSNYVLSKPSRADEALIAEAIQKALGVLPSFFKQGIGMAMQALH